MELGFSDASPRGLEMLNDLDRTTFLPVSHTPAPPGFYGDTRVMLMKIMTIVVIAGGTLGNVLTILVLLRQRKKISSTSMYLLTLAISDTCLLWTSPFRAWMKYMWDIDVRKFGNYSCKIYSYFSYTFVHISSWILVAVTLERAICIVASHKIKLCCTQKCAGAIIACILVIIFGIDSVIPIISSIEDFQPLAGHNHVICAPSTKEFTEFRENIWEWIDISLSFLVPFICLLIGNIMTIRFLQNAKNFQQTVSVSKSGHHKMRSLRSVTILTIALCITFFLTMTPVTIFQVYYPYKYDRIREMYLVDPFKARESYQYLLLQQEIVNLVSYINASINFVVYVFSGTKFRAELKALLCCSTKRQSTLFESSKQSTTKSRAESTLYNTITSTLPKKKSTIYKNIFTDSLRQLEIKKKGNYVNTTHLNDGKDKLIFISDNAITSLSSILSNQVNKDVDNEKLDTDHDDSIHVDDIDVFINYEIIFSNDPKYDIVVEGKEMNGFILHL